MSLDLSLAGLLIGLLVGMTGMGGGSLMTPMLVLVFGFKPTVAIGTDILHGAIFKSFGAVRHRQLGHVHARLTMWMLLGSAPASLAGVALSTWLEHRYGDGFEDTAQQILGACARDRRARPSSPRRSCTRDSDDAPFLLSNRDRVIAVLLGLSGGFVVGLTSVGSGHLLRPRDADRLPAHRGQDRRHGPLPRGALLWVAGAGHFVAGNVDLGATAWLLVGSIPGVLIGSQITVKLPDRALRVALALVLSLSGIKLLEPPGANAIVVTVAAAAIVVGIVVGARRLLGGRPAPAGVD